MDNQTLTQTAPEVTPQQLLFIDSLLHGGTLEASAERAGVPRATACLWMGNRTFRDTLEIKREKYYEAKFAALRALAEARIDEMLARPKKRWAWVLKLSRWFSWLTARQEF